MDVKDLHSPVKMAGFCTVHKMKLFFSYAVQNYNLKNSLKKTFSLWKKKLNQKDFYGKQ